MIKALLKKQMGEMLCFLTQSGKKGRRRSKGITLLYAFLFAYAGAAVALQFAFLMDSLCGPLTKAGLGWLYFALAGLLATVMAVVMGLFLAQSQLFEAKDNEMLLALPVPVFKIVFSRMVPLYLQNFLVESLALVPAAAVYHMRFGLSGLQAAEFSLLLLLLPLLGLALTCVLGWLTAVFSARIRWKNFATTVLSLALLGAYLAFYLKINEWLQMLLANSAAVGDGVRGALYPLYLLGKGLDGDPAAFLLFSGMTLLLFGLAYWAVSKSFWRIAAGRSAARTAYRGKSMKARPAGLALLEKELRRFLKTPIYLLNCGLGAVFLLIIAGAALFRGKELPAWAEGLPLPGGSLPILGCGFVSAVASMDLVTASSISLESRSLELLRSLPVSGRQVLGVKLGFHMLVTTPAALLCGLATAWALDSSPAVTLFSAVLPVLFVLLSGELGLLFNLRFPYLDWNTETAAVKQSPAVALALFSCWGVLAVFAGLYFLLGNALGPEGFLPLCGGILAVLCAVLLWMLNTWGVKRFLEID